MIKFLIGGSPCTHWSIAQSKNRETTAEGIGWELFKNYLIAKEKFKPDFFLYENNKSVASAIKEQISAELGVPIQYINSALVSAQTRQRLYCHNFGDVPQPADRGIPLRDVLERGLGFGTSDGKSYALRATYYKGQSPEKILKYHERTHVAEPVIFNNPHGFNKGGIKHDKAPTLTANGKYQDNNLVIVPAPHTLEEENSPVRVAEIGASGGQGQRVYDVNAKSPHVRANGRQESVAIRVGTIENDAKNQDHDSKQYRVYSPEGKAVTLCGQGGGLGAKTGLYAVPLNENKSGKSRPIDAHFVYTIDGKRRPIYEVRDGYITIKGKQYQTKLPDGLYIIRKLTVTECCRLQTLPDDYCHAVSATQGYKGLGNGWTAEVIIHLLSHALRGIPKDEEIAVLSMYDGIGTGRYCFDKLGYRNIRYYAYEIDKYAQQIAMSNYPDIMQCGDAFQVREAGWDFAQAGMEVITA